MSPVFCSNACWIPVCEKVSMIIRTSNAMLTRPYSEGVNIRATTTIFMMERICWTILRLKTHTLPENTFCDRFGIPAPSSCCGVISSRIGIL